ncbi:MAG: hypothetical protein ACM31C_33185 [Acidobacteriota bacterium]
MRKLLPALFAAATVMAVVSTAHAQYQVLARQALVLRNQSAEILRVHASVNVEMRQALDETTLPPVIVLPRRA